jgi:hypothetical protein
MTDLGCLEILTAKLLIIPVFWDVKQYSWTSANPAGQRSIPVHWNVNEKRY